MALYHPKRAKDNVVNTPLSLGENGTNQVGSQFL